MGERVAPVAGPATRKDRTGRVPRASGCLAVLLAFVLLAAACSSDGGGGPAEGAAGPGSSDTSAQPIDYAAIGLWDDGPCDASRAPLKIGLMTVFESPVLSLGDHATALEASAKAFNQRGGANGACIQVVTCDDGGNVDQAVACVRTIDDAGVVATVNDLGTAGQAEVSTAMADAGIPRVASNVSNQDWGDHNAYPLDASGTGLIFLLPQALIEEGVTQIGIVRVDLAAASALKGLLADTYDGEATFPVDLPVAAGTTDYSQFILAADSGGAEGLALALGEQEAVQVARAAEQLDSDLVLGGAVSAFPPATIRQLGDLADQLVLLWSYAPATADLPVYEALRADLSASGDEALQPEHLTATAMRSWIGLYALIEMIRDAHLTEFTRAGITTMLDQAHDVPMLGMFGGEDWTPALDHPGVFQRAGINRWSIWGWDAQADNPDGTEGNFVPRGDLSFDEVMCGTPFGAPGPC